MQFKSINSKLDNQGIVVLTQSLILTNLKTYYWITSKSIPSYDWIESLHSNEYNGINSIIENESYYSFNSLERQISYRNKHESGIHDAINTPFVIEIVTPLKHVWNVMKLGA